MTRDPPQGSATTIRARRVRATAHRLALVTDVHLLDMDPSAEIRPAFLTQTEVAVLLGVLERTLEGWRLTRSGPPWLKLGRHVRYDRGDVLAWAREQRRAQAEDRRR